MKLSKYYYNELGQVTRVETIYNGYNAVIELYVILNTYIFKKDNSAFAGQILDNGNIEIKYNNNKYMDVIIFND